MAMTQSLYSSSGRTVIATAFVVDAPGEESIFPQVGSKSSSLSFQKIYWRCIVCLFATSRRYNPAALHVLFCNMRPPHHGDEDFAAILKNIGVEIVVTPFTQRDPNLRLTSFGNVMYTFDALAAAARLYPSQRIVLLDSDCVWLRGIAPLERQIDRSDILLYDIGYALDDPWNGVTRRELGAAARELLPKPPTFVPQATGGEFIALSPKGLRRVLASFQRLWPLALERRRKGKAAPLTEEHYLSLIAAELGADTAIATATIKRVWTAFRHNTTAPGDLDLMIWHLPSEKRTGFASLFREVRQPNSRFWRVAPGEEMACHLASHFGVPQRSARKLAIDLADRIVARMRR
jgi:hypothetical protein